MHGRQSEAQIITNKKFSIGTFNLMGFMGFILTSLSETHMPGSLSFCIQQSLVQKKSVASHNLKI